jgi:hypothetical protein
LKYFCPSKKTESGDVAKSSVTHAFPATHGDRRANWPSTIPKDTLQDGGGGEDELGDDGLGWEVGLGALPFVIAVTVHIRSPKKKTTHNILQAVIHIGVYTVHASISGTQIMPVQFDAPWHSTMHANGFRLLKFQKHKV